MANKTNYLELTKPQPNEFYDIEVFNENADLIDNAVKIVNESLKVDGLVKGDGTGNLSAATTGADYSGAKLDKNWTLLVGSWQGEEVPYTYTISDSDIWAGETIDLYEAASITEDQRKQLMDAQIGREAAQSDGSVTIKAWGEKPTDDLPVSAVLRRDQR